MKRRPSETKKPFILLKSRMISLKNFTSMKIFVPKKKIFQLSMKTTKTLYIPFPSGLRFLKYLSKIQQGQIRFLRNSGRVRISAILLKNTVSEISVKRTADVFRHSKKVNTAVWELLLSI